MANKNQKAAQTAQAQTTKVNDAEDNVMEEIRSKNIGEQSIAEAVDKQLKDEQNQRLIEDTKRKVCEAEYCNLKARLMLRARRREEKATKEYLTATKELLDQLRGYKNEKGEFVAPTLTIFQYEDKRREITKKRKDAFSESDRQFREEMKELRYQYPQYWSYEWDN